MIRRGSRQFFHRRDNQSQNISICRFQAKTVAACCALQDKNLMPQSQDFSSQSRTGTQTDESKRQKM